jgi:hypothetical protein
LHIGAADEPAIGVDSYRRILERMTSTADGFTIAAVRNGRGQLPWYGSFDQFGYYDAAATELGSHETTWSNFLACACPAPRDSIAGSTISRTMTRPASRSACHVGLSGGSRQRDNDRAGRRGDEECGWPQVICSGLQRNDSRLARSPDAPRQCNGGWWDE